MADSLVIPSMALSRSTYRIRLSTALLSLVATCALLFFFRFQGVLVNLEFSLLCTLVALFVITMIGLVGADAAGGFWSPSSSYLALLAIFHFGIVIVYGFNLLSSDARSGFERWFFVWPTPEALVLAVIGLTSCALGIGLATLVSRHDGAAHDSTPRQSVIDDRSRSLDRSFAIVGGVLVSLAVLAWFALVLTRGGIELLFASYVEYLDATAGSPVGYVWLALGIGLCFLVGTPRASSPGIHLIAYMAFAFFAMFALPLGLRGEVLFTAFAAVVIRAKRGKRPSLKQTGIIVVAILLAISVIQEVRQVGLTAGLPALANGNILDALTEMGSSLRPVVEVVRWHEQGEDFINGASYVAPLERPLCTVLPLSDCVPAGEDTRLMNVLVMERVGAIGFSPIAEAFRNFGEGGVVLVLLIIGAIVGTLSRLPSRPVVNAVSGVILVGLMINVRNAFTQVPFHIVFGFCCVVAAVLLARLMDSKPTHRSVEALGTQRR